MTNNTSGLSCEFEFEFDKWKELAKLDSKAFEVQKRITLCGLVCRSKNHRELLKNLMLKLGITNCCDIINK